MRATAFLPGNHPLHWTFRTAAALPSWRTSSSSFPSQCVSAIADFSSRDFSPDSEEAVPTRMSLLFEGALGGDRFPPPFLVVLSVRLSFLPLGDEDFLQYEAARTGLNTRRGILTVECFFFPFPRSSLPALLYNFLLLRLIH